MSCRHWGDGWHWGDGTHWCTTESTSDEYLAKTDLIATRVSPRITYVANSHSKTTFRLYRISALAGYRQQTPDQFVAWTDCLGDRFSPRVAHTGSEFIINNMRAIAQVKKQIPKG